MLFIERPDFVWGLIASMYIANIVAVVLVLATVPLFASILRIPFSIIGPVIVVVCFVGAYTVNSGTFDLWLVLAVRPGRLSSSRSSTTRWRRWSWRWCWATRRRMRSVSR